MCRTLRLLLFGTLCLWPLLAASHFNLKEYRENLSAQAGYDRDDYGAFYETWRRLAEMGQALAQCNVGMMYAEGYGVDRDDGRAIHWFRKAAEQGYTEAQYQLGLRHGFGEYAYRDHVEALAWLTVSGRDSTVEQKAYLIRHMTAGEVATARELAQGYREVYVVPFEKVRESNWSSVRVQLEPHLGRVGNYIVVDPEVARRNARRLLAFRMTCNGVIAPATPAP